MLIWVRSKPLVNLVPLKPGSRWTLSAWNFCFSEYVPCHRPRGAILLTALRLAPIRRISSFTRIQVQWCTLHSSTSPKICARGLKKAPIDRNRGACQVLSAPTTFAASSRLRLTRSPSRGAFATLCKNSHYGGAKPKLQRCITKRERNVGYAQQCQAVSPSAPCLSAWNLMGSLEF